MTENWPARWASGRTGWHETDGNAGLKSHWRVEAESVLVPLCGKSPDLRWLALRGHEVIGVELSEVAVRQFLAEQNLEFILESGECLDCYTCTELPITLYCGDFFNFEGGPFDALYDRAALVALAADVRPHYVEHMKRLLKPSAAKFVVTLEYDQSIVSGPPFSVVPAELASYWGDLKRVYQKDDIDNCPPKFRDAGLEKINEVFWASGP